MCSAPCHRWLPVTEEVYHVLRCTNTFHHFGPHSDRVQIADLYKSTEDHAVRPPCHWARDVDF